MPQVKTWHDLCLEGKQRLWENPSSRFQRPTGFLPITSQLSPLVTLHATGLELPSSAGQSPGFSPMPLTQCISRSISWPGRSCAMRMSSCTGRIVPSGKRSAWFPRGTHVMCLVYTGGRTSRRPQSLTRTPTDRWALFLTLQSTLTFVVHIEFIGVRGIFSSMGVPSAPDLQPKLQRVYLGAFFISCTKGGSGSS